ncbi:GH92 family glycosyl hydrolase [Asticcacaulis taihuensis]|uniref:GH92 family glycosyl hydrolase n=1 Tax=Asticcacaulis taihuensis TaxID=260084 RepID=UPI003F7B8463
MYRFQILPLVALFTVGLTSAALADPAGSVAQAQGLSALADPFVGVDGGSTVGGNTVPGAQIPFGFVTFSPDTTRGDTNGYDSASPIMGLSLTHVSGTGGDSQYGNFRISPTVGPLRANHLLFAKSQETASPGYYSVILGNAPDETIKTEVTATRMVGFMRLTFPTATGERASMPGNVILNVSSIVEMGGKGQRATASHVDIIDDHTLSGWASFEGAWNPTPYRIYFYAVFDRPSQEVGAWRASQGGFEAHPGTGSLDGLPQSLSLAHKQSVMVDYDIDQAFAHKLGGYARFDIAKNPVVQVKVAVSFISAEKARAHLAAEAPGWDFDAMRLRSQALWDQALSKITVDGGTEAQRRIFYTALYHSETMPHDLSGDNAWWESAEPHYEDFYTLWDTFRTLHPLLTLIEPQRQRDMIRSLLDTYKHTGWLPDARIAGANGMTQGGSNGDVVVADAVVKHLGGFDYDLAYAALKTDGEVESDQPLLQGRVLKDYLKLGYVSLSQPRSASRTLEYAYNDYAIAEVASRLGKHDDAARYLARSQGWQQLWDDKLGCIRPRYADGAWLENYSCTYDYPDKSTPWWEAPYYEGSGQQYSTYVPHDVSGLISQVGGAEAFTVWLDRLFDTGHYSQGNEPDILAPYLYIHAGRPDRTAKRIRQIMADNYSLKRTGLPGNDDAGAMSSWFVWNAIGLYPNAGQPFYYIGSPLFAASTVHLEGGKSFTIRAHNNSADNIYVVAARLNGKSLNRAWLTHEEIVSGGTLDLDMAPVPGTWANQFTSPPSIISPQ